MPAIPFPFITLALLLILLVKVCLQPAQDVRNTALFLGSCALLVLLTALRWQFDLRILRQLQSSIALCLPALAWYCFASFTAHQRRKMLLLCLLPPLLAQLVQLSIPAITDTVLMLIYVGYGAALIFTARQGADALVFAHLSEANRTSRMALLAGGFLCFSALTDLAIALDFHLYQGLQAPQLVALSQAILLPFICLAIVFRGKTLHEALPAAPESRKADVQNEDLLTACQHIENRVREGQLFLNAELTLNTLSRKLGLPARQISQAVNQTRGCNVSQWINHFRIEHARQLLRHSDAPVTAIMLDSGFATKSNFNREFMRITGMSPTEYRLAALTPPAPGAEKP